MQQDVQVTSWFAIVSHLFCVLEVSMRVNLVTLLKLIKQANHRENSIELNCMHETNKIELKLIEVDARSYLGLLTNSAAFIYYLGSAFFTTEEL